RRSGGFSLLIQFLNTEASLSPPRLCRPETVCKQSAEACNKKYVPVCGSNGDTYQNECFLRRAACKKQRAISIVSEGACYHGNTHPLTSST
uniref:Kazal-like domain-containing protein n=1 Tax=Poecilia latipinna TaxID=48699 RepID=A0A3B3TQJ7_9TELE